MANRWIHFAGSLRRSTFTVRVSLWIGLLSCACGALSAANITGSVLNGTGSRSAGGDEVILYRVDHSMHETAHTQTDAQGHFYFRNQGAGRFLVAVTHGRVAYHSAVVNGFSPVLVTVFDTVSTLPTSDETPEITVFPELDGESLKITEFFVYRNVSHPARTLLSRHMLELAMPAGAVLNSIAAQPETTLPFPLRAFACGGAGRYCVSTPIRPGRTTLRVIYHSPARTRIAVPQPFKQAAVVLPGNLALLNAKPATFRLTSDSAGKRLYQVKSTAGGKPLTFRLSRGTCLDASGCGND